MDTDALPDTAAIEGIKMPLKQPNSVPRSQNLHRPSSTRIKCLLVGIFLLLVLHSLYTIFPISPFSYGTPTNKSKLGLGEIYVLSGNEQRESYFRPLLDGLNLDYKIFRGYTSESPSMKRVLDQVFAWRNSQDSNAKIWGATDGEVAGRIGCTLGHVAIWKDIAERGIETALIMEDDIDIDVSLEVKLREVMAELNGDWDILMPGYCSFLWAESDLSEDDFANMSYRQLRRSACGHGYIVTQRAVQKMLARPEIREPNFETPWDVHLAHFISDGVIDKAYATLPEMIVQRPRTKNHPSLVTVEDREDGMVPSEIAQAATPVERIPNAFDETVGRDWRFRQALPADRSAAYKAGVSYWHKPDQAEQR